ncbi:MAG: hypothetical protein GIW95_10565, partial [Candidatus Eremiobacteraeota bacterium]|nr:hypothetical protein [Candidatus Eremiobacteraeota bacterium]
MSKRVAALLLMLGLTLNACSHRSASSVMPANGSPSGVPAGLIQRTGHIVLPAGSPIDPATLTVSNSLGSGRVSPSGGFALNAFPDGPQYAAVRNASGKLVMTAFLSDGEPDASVHSTAQTMLFFALGGFALPSTLQLQVLAQIGTLAKEQNLEGALSAALVSTGSDPLGSNKPAIGAAIQAGVPGVRPASAQRRPAGARRVPKGLTFDPS